MFFLCLLGIKQLACCHLKTLLSKSDLEHFLHLQWPRRHCLANSPFLCSLKCRRSWFQKQKGWTSLLFLWWWLEGGSDLNGVVRNDGPADDCIMIFWCVWQWPDRWSLFCCRILWFLAPWERESSSGFVDDGSLDTLTNKWHQTGQQWLKRV